MLCWTELLSDHSTVDWFVQVQHNRPFQYCACVFYLCMVKVDSIHGKFLHIFQKVHLCFCWSHSSKNTNTNFNCCCLGLLTMFNFHILWPIGFVQFHDLLLHFFGLIRSKTKFTDVICTTLICNTQRDRQVVTDRERQIVEVRDRHKQVVRDTQEQSTATYYRVLLQYPTVLYPEL